MTETPFFFPSGTAELFGVLHEPGAGGQSEAFVFCHPFGEEKLWAHRVFVSFARRLARAGHTVLRFDFMGAGDSDGDLAGCSLESSVQDVHAAIDTLRARVGARPVTLLGLRFGATIAALAADGRADVGRLILWAPIVHGGRYMQELLRINLTTQVATRGSVTEDREAMVAAMQTGRTVNVDGYEMPWAFFSQSSAVDLSSTPPAVSGSSLIVQVDRQAGRPAPELQRLAAALNGATVAFAAEEPFWKEIARFYEEASALFTVTEDWLRGHP